MVVRNVTRGDMLEMSVYRVSLIAYRDQRYAMCLLSFGTMEDNLFLRN